MSDNDWRVYRGSSQRDPHAIDRLPAPPSWRRFDGEMLDGVATAPADIGGPLPDMGRRAAAYRPARHVVDMVNAALYLRRPLLVTGRPGTGKSTLAYSIAWELQLGPVLRWPITSRSQLQDSLYRYDAIGRLQDTNLRRLREAQDLASRVADFITLGPLGTALVPGTRPRVLLIDEFDKGDIDLATDLLHVLEEGQFLIPELVREAAGAPVSVATASAQPATITNGLVRCRAFPIIVITSNGERDFPSAFTRRCLQVTIPEPDAAKLAEIVHAQLGEEVLADAESLFDSFLQHRDEANLATDHLLNAIYLVTAGLTDGPTRDRVVSALFGQGQPEL